MTNDPTRPQPSPFPPPEPGPTPRPVPGRGDSHPAQSGTYPSQTGTVQGQPTYAPPGQPAFQAPHPQPAVPSFIPPSAASVAANSRSRGGSSAGALAFVVAVVIAAAGLGFAGGRLTAPTAATARGFAGRSGGNFPAFNPNASGNPNRGGFGRLAGGTVSIDGQVTAVANGSITVQTPNGQSITLQVPSTATYHAQAPATSSDVTVGSQVQLSVSRPNGRAEGSGQPEASGQPGTVAPGGFGFTVTDITVVGK